jgi:hypothetical protein
VLPAQGAGRDSDAHERDHQHDADRGEHGRPALDQDGRRGALGTAERVEHEHGGDHDRRDLGEESQEQRRVEHPRRVVENREHLAGPRPVGLGELLGAGAGERGQGGFGAAEQSGDQDQPDHDHQQHGTLPAHLEITAPLRSGTARD